MQLLRNKLFGIAALALTIGACGSDSEEGGGGAQPIGNEFGLAFSPVYTAFDGQHDYRVPIIAQNGVQVDKWQVVDANGVPQDDVADFSVDSATGGTILTSRKAGDYFILARAGKTSGCAHLQITAGTPAEWEVGQKRYNNEIILTSLIPENMMPAGLPDDISCKNCHGTGAQFLAVEHTPQQTGGYSDQDLINILTMGIKPTPPDPSVAADCTPYAWNPSKTGIPLALYRYFHTWTATPEESKGLVLYLRSLAPMSQGALDFAGIMPPGGATP